MLDDSLKTQLQAYLEKIVRPVHIVACLDDSPKSRELEELLDQIVQLSHHLTLQSGPGTDERKPSFSLHSPGHDIHMRFAGVPMGHEFTSLVLALLQVGGHPARVAREVIERAKELEGDYRFETYFSMSCQNCPDVVQALNLMAVLNPDIRHVAIDGALFQDEVEQRQVMSVPTIYLNGQFFGQGRMSAEEIVAKLDAGTPAREAGKLAGKAPYDVLVIGGGPAGASAAIYSARNGRRTGLVAERFGGQLLDTATIENFISVPKTEGPRLASQLEQHVGRHQVEVMKLLRAESLGADGELLHVRMANGASLKARVVILATGARWRKLNVPGEDEYRNRGVAYFPHCDRTVYKGGRVAVIGGGNSGVESAIELAGIAAHVTLIEYDHQLRADAVLQRKLHSLRNVQIVTSARTTEIIGDGSAVNGLVYVDRGSQVERVIRLDGVFVQIGLLPNTEWLEGTVALSPHGEIIVDDRGRTSIPGVFAAGDATTVPYRQIVKAMAEGSKAALSAFDHLIRSSAPPQESTARAA